METILALADYTTLTDHELLVKLNQSDQAAFDAIYKRYWRTLYQAAYRVLRDHEGAMDVVQEVFIWVWKKHADLQVRVLSAYLHTAVKFKVANYIRNGKIRSSLFEEVQHIEEPAVLSEDTLEVKELQEMIAAFTETLPEKCRQVFLLSRVEDLTNKQIAKQMGISVKTVENQMTTALKKLRVSLARMFYLLLFF